MRLFVILILSVVLAGAYAQCIVDSDCNDNIPCTKDECFHTYCNFIPTDDSCYVYYCTATHCKLHLYLSDTCGCVSVMYWPTVDSFSWNIFGTPDVWFTQDNTYCFDTLRGYYTIEVNGYDNGAEWRRRGRFYFPDCGCQTNSDCDDNNLCTIDQCYNGQCLNQKGYSTSYYGGSFLFEQWKADCCCH